MSLVSSLLDALSTAFGMFWEILWALILGFALSAAVDRGPRDAQGDGIKHTPERR
jgi:hypothetical protein